VTPAALIRDLQARGFSLAVAGGALRVRPTSGLTPADRAAIRAHLPALLAELTAATAIPGAASGVGPAWHPAEARRLMAEADGLVEQLGVDGRHPRITAAAALVASAYATRDLETVRFAVAEFTATVREVFAGQVGANPKRYPPAGRGSLNQIGGR
jgi:hypothetical protein